MRRLFLFPVLMGVVASLAPGSQRPPNDGKLTIESLIDIKHPSLPAW